MTSYDSAWVDKLRPHQHQAVHAALAALANDERATVVMACGTGKTRVGAAIAATRMQHAGASRILIVAPYLELLSQAIREYRATCGDSELGRVVAVCSDPRVLDEYRGDLYDQHARVTSDAAELAQLAAGPGRITVVSTDASLPVLATAHEHGLPRWDVGKMDEAHRSVGRVNKQWAMIHRNAHTSVDRRLYLAATPNVILGGGDDVVSMDDEKIFGKTVHRLTFFAASQQGLLAGYRVVAPVITKEQIRAAARRPQPAEFYQSGKSALSASMLATQIAVLRAAHEYSLRRIITFHNRVRNAEWFAATLRHAATLLDPGEQPADLWTGHVHGRQPLAQRRTILERLRSDDNSLTVVANARVLGEGIDVPDAGCVAFIDSRDSPIDTIQAIGRALRRGNRPGPKTATIIVPVLLGPGEDPETALSTSAYALVWQIVRALATHDDALSGQLSVLRRQLGEYSSSTAQSQQNWELPEWLRVTGVPIPPGFSRAIAVQTVRAGTHSWEELYGAAASYRAQHGDLLVHAAWKSPSQLPVGSWINYLRKLYKDKLLAPEWIDRMNALGMVWDVLELNRQRTLAELRKYKKKYGDLRVPRNFTTDDDLPYPLGPIVNNLRGRRTAGKLDDDYEAELTAEGMIWHVFDQDFEQFLTDLKDYKKANGALEVPQKCRTPGPNGRRVGLQVPGYRSRQKKQDLSVDVIEALDTLGFIWDVREHRFRQNLQALYAYKHTHNGNANVPATYVTPAPEKIALGACLYRGIASYLAGTQPSHRTKALRQAGVSLPHQRAKR
ncbi:Helicase associated domain protein [Nonomuraea sp. NPDC046802]|uniref:DEAD/DEAH box helicase n=1 Tax=Nonomuraea sp. NPDC046802 TaxID=3154919 RepID=UPI0033F842E6